MEKSTSKREFRFETNSETGSLKLIDENDQTVFETNVTDYPTEIQDQYSVHGAKQKYTDDTMTAKLKDGQTRVQACEELHAQLMRGEWVKERESVVRPPEALIVFVVERKKVSREDAVASLRTAGKEKWAAIIKSNEKDIAAIVARIAKAKADAAGVDLSDLG